MTSHELNRTIAACAIAVSALAFGMRAAAADAAQDAYEKDYEAIEVKTACEPSGAPDPATMTRLASYIAGQAKFTMSAGQSLTEMEQAKHDARQLTKGSGCKSDASKQMVTLYHQLESAAH